MKITINNKIGSRFRYTEKQNFELCFSVAPKT